jgi:hypothetical protein
MTVTVDQTAPPSERLAPVRRTYLYIVALVSLAVALAGMGSLVDALTQLWLEQPVGAVGTSIYNRGLASSAGLLLVATPIFLVHWGLAQGRRAEADERASLLRKLFLYAATALSLSWMVIVAYVLINETIVLAFGQPLAQSTLWPAEWLSLLIMGVTNGALVAYWYAMLQGDGDFGRERTSGRIVRQIFMFLAGLAGLVLMLWGASSALQVLLRLLVDTLVGRDGTELAAVTIAGLRWWQNDLAGALTQLLVGAWLAHINRAQWHEIVAGQPQEGQAALRRLYLYASVVIGAIATLTPAALLLRELLLMTFGDAGGTLAELLDKLIVPISFVPVGLTIWLWHWRVLQQEANAFGESNQGATVRRIYYYLVAATGLALMWVGLVELLHALLDTLLTGMAGPTSIWHEPLANGLSLLAVGAPIWALHWRSVQRIAGQANAAGSDERDALMRKIYLYGVALIGALIILFQLAQVIYRLLLVLMGDNSAGLMTTETAHQLADCLVAGLIWAVHLLAIRTDARLERAMPKPLSPAEQPASAQVAAAQAFAPAFDPAATPAVRRAALEQRRAELEEELAQVERELAALQAPTLTPHS